LLKLQLVFLENWQKSQKIVITTSTPGFEPELSYRAGRKNARASLKFFGTAAIAKKDPWKRVY
jgi:hypothetical protein